MQPGTRNGGLIAVSLAVGITLGAVIVAKGETAWEMFGRIIAEAARPVEQQNVLDSIRQIVEASTKIQSTLATIADAAKNSGTVPASTKDDIETRLKEALASLETAEAAINQVLEENGLGSELDEETSRQLSATGVEAKTERDFLMVIVNSVAECRERVGTILVGEATESEYGRALYLSGELNKLAAIYLRIDVIPSG